MTSRASRATTSASGWPARGNGSSKRRARSAGVSGVETAPSARRVDAKYSTIRRVNASAAGAVASYSLSSRSRFVVVSMGDGRQPRRVAFEPVRIPRPAGRFHGSHTYTQRRIGVMRRSLAVSTFVVAVIVGFALPARAQRGGGGRGRGMDESTVTKTSFDSPDKTVGFVVPPDVRLFTPESPGRFGEIFKSGYIAYLINPVGGEVTIGIKAIPGATEADLKGLRETLDANPPQAKQPGYKKVSVGDVKVGTKQNKDAVDHVYTAEVNKKLITTRDVMFVHGQNGYRI